MQGIFQKENTDKALKYGIYRHLPTYEKIIRNLVSFYYKKILREGESTTQLCTGFLIDHARVEKKYWKLLNEFQIQVYQESVEAGPFENYQKAWEYYTGEL